jgi:hypothetical protein
LINGALPPCAETGAAGFQETATELAENAGIIRQKGYSVSAVISGPVATPRHRRRSADPKARSSMHAPSSPMRLPEAQDRDRGADHLAPDCAGQNFYAIDRGLRDLLRLYLVPEDFRRLEPHFDRLGVLAGGKLDELARAADKHPPVLNPRDRFGRDQDWIDYHSSYREMEKIAFGDFQFHAMSHRAGTLRMGCNICSCRPSSG